MKNVNGTSRLSKFGFFFDAIQIFSCRDWWSWTKPGYITMTRRQINNQWSEGTATQPAANIPSVKIRWKSSRLDFLGSRRHPPHWLSSKGPNYQRGVLIISAGAIEWHFEGKTQREVHQGGLVLARQCPGSPGTCGLEETGLPGLPMSWSPILFSGSGPSDYHLFPGLKKQMKGRHFSSDTEVIAAAETWLDRQRSEVFLSGLQKLEQGAKKCIDLRGEYVEWIPSLVTSLFPSWSG